MRRLLARLTVASLGLAVIAGCSDEDWSAEHPSLGELTITLKGAGAISTRTWNRSSTCSLDEDAGATTTCTFSIEDDAAEIVIAPLDPTATVELVVTACGKAASDDSFEARGNGIALWPREVLLGAGCPSYPVHVEARFSPLPPDDDAGNDASDGATEDAADAAIDDAEDAADGA